MKRFQVALSFPGEKRAFLKEVADGLASILGREKVLYDNYLTAELARPNLDVYLARLYHEESELIVPFFCSDYEKKEWCGLEYRQVRDLLKKKNDEQIMPFRFDDSPIPGQLSIDGYIMIGDRAAGEVVDLILQRLTVATTKTATQEDGKKSAGPDHDQDIYYLFASKNGSVTSSRDVVSSIQGGKMAQALVRLLKKEYGSGDNALEFQFQSAGSISEEERILLVESLENLSNYDDPDRFIYDPVPSDYTMLLARIAKRTEKWSEILEKRFRAEAASGHPTTDDAKDTYMDSAQRLNAGLNLLMLLAQCYYKLLESTIGNHCAALDLSLNQSYFWTIKNLKNLLGSHEGLKDFPVEFQPYFPDLYPNTILDVDWDMVAPEAETFLSAVQQYVLHKGIYDPEDNSEAFVFVALFRPSIDDCLANAENYRKRMKKEFQRILASTSEKKD